MSDILSQAEIDLILSRITSGEAPIEEIVEEKESKKIKVYDFKRPDRFSKEQVRTIHMIHETFGRLWSSRLSNILRTVVSMSVASVEQVIYQEFARSIFDPSVLAVFAMPPLDGNGLFDFNPAIVFPIIDRLLGGSGQTNVRIRELTEIEKRIVTSLLIEALKFMGDAWESVLRLELRLMNLESNPLFVNLVSPNDMTLIITMETRIENFTGNINLCYPYIVLEPILPKLSAQFFFSGTRGQNPKNKERILDSLYKMELPLVVELGRTMLSFRDICALQPGDLIRLPSKVGEPLKITINDKHKFNGYPGLVKKNLAVVISEVVENYIPEEDK